VSAAQRFAEQTRQQKRLKESAFSALVSGKPKVCTAAGQFIVWRQQKGTPHLWCPSVLFLLIAVS
jgi:hypothetical protein